MLRQMPKQVSFHTSLYNKIPKNHILKRIKDIIDFSFLNELLADGYCKNFGRPAKEPALMCKLLFLQAMYGESDKKLIENANLNIAYLYFLDLNPEDELPDASLLSKFRTTRLKEYTLDEIITEIVKQCVEKGIIKCNSVSIDATHIEANTIRKTPERLMKHLARNIIKDYYEETSEKLENIPFEPEYEKIEDHKEAKAVMKTYLENVIEETEKNLSDETTDTKKAIDKAREILSDPKFINQKGVRSLVDEDARVGRKSKSKDFFGYKAEFVMTTDERVITSVRTAHGAYIDGTYAEEMLGQTREAGVDLKEVYGDKAYFRKNILDVIEKLEARAYIPVSGVVYRINEEEFSYNKDSDEWQCSEGNLTVNKKYFTSKTKEGLREGYKYYFEINQCKSCPKHDECAKKGARKILAIGLNTNEFYEISQYQKSDEFREKYKKWASIEGKNAEIKRFHGLCRAKGYGLKSVSKQAKLTAIAVNLKRIAAIVSSFPVNFIQNILVFRIAFGF